MKRTSHYKRGAIAARPARNPFARKLNHVLPRAIFDAPTKADRTRPAIYLPGGRALFRCDVPPRSQPRRAFGLGTFSSIRTQERGRRTTRHTRPAADVPRGLQWTPGGPTAAGLKVLRGWVVAPITRGPVVVRQQQTRFCTRLSGASELLVGGGSTLFSIGSLSGAGQISFTRAAPCHA